MKRRTTRVTMVEEQLVEIDNAREKIKKELDSMVNQKDVTYIVDALIKLQKAERELYDEVYIQSGEGDEFDVSELVG